MSAKSMMFALVALALLLTGTTIWYQSTTMPSQALQKEEIEKIIRAYILKNPQLIEEAIIYRRKAQLAEQEKKQKEAVVENSDQLFKASHDYVAGNPDGDVTVVEFFDYNCGFCRRAFKDVANVIKQDKNIRVVFKEMPIFGEQSILAAKAAIASMKQNKYFEFHRDMLIEPGRAGEAKAYRIAEKLGMDVEKLKNDMKDPEVAKALVANSALANKIGLEGTPFYVIGDKIINGAPEDLADRILANVKAIRAAKSN